MHWQEFRSHGKILGLDEQLLCNISIRLWILSTLFPEEEIRTSFRNELKPLLNQKFKGHSEMINQKSLPSSVAVLNNANSPAERFSVNFNLPFHKNLFEEQYNPLVTTHLFSQIVWYLLWLVYGGNKFVNKLYVTD